MRGDDIIGLACELFQQAGAQIGAQAILRAPLGDHPGGPASLFGQVEDPAAAGEQVADAVNHAAREQGREGLAVSHDIERRMIEEVVVGQEIAGYRGVRVPSFDVRRYSFRPRRHEHRILIAVADAVNAKNVEACHGEVLLRLVRWLMRRNPANFQAPAVMNLDAGVRRL